VFRDDLGIEASARIARSPTIEALSATFSEAVGELGMQASASGMVSGPRAVSRSPFHFTNWPPAWMAVYRERGFLARDPIPRWAIISGEAISWTDAVKRLPANDPGREVAETAADHGFHEGFVTPVRTLAGALGLVSVGGGRRSAFTLTERTVLQTLSILTLNRAEAILGAGGEKPIPAAFSLRERECHALLQQGFTDNEIARVLGISGETVRFHLSNARKKAGARNRVHLAALQLGTLDPGEAR
jgi:DNA-binding CsgD family transcriptional regulator